MPDSRYGSSVYKARELCERALRKIGAFSINDDAAQDNELYEALYWLDMLMAYTSGINRCFWLVQDELSFALVSEQSDYSLATVLASLKTGIQFPIACYLEDANGNRREIPIVSQKTFRDTVLPSTTGTPTCVFIDRLNGPTLHTYPVPQDADETSSLVLTVQTFPDSVKPAGLTSEPNISNEKAGFRPAWNLWAVTALAALTGDGPVRRLPAQTVQLWKQEAMRLKAELDGFENQEHDNEPPYAKPSVYQ